MKKLLVFGASGKSGREIVRMALDRNYAVDAFVRDPLRMLITHDNLRVMQGDVLKFDHVKDAIHQPDAVIVALGGVSNQNVRSEGTQNIISALADSSCRRLLAMSSLGVGDTYDMLPAATKNFIVPMFLQRFFEDHALQEEYLEKSDLDWTVIRPGNLLDGPPKLEYKWDTVPRLGLQCSIRRSDVADLFLKLVDSPESYGKKYWQSY